MAQRLVLAAVIALWIAISGAGSAHASCALPPSLPDEIKSSPLVFVGTVLYTSDGDRVARVRVESIWKGPDLAAYVDVHGSPLAGSGQATSVDRTYQGGTRYLFVLYSAEQPLSDNDCSGTRPYTDDIASLRPDSARGPAPATPLDEAQNLAGEHGWLLTGLAVVLIAGAAALIFRRRLKVRR
jgi:hypothetical protein